MLAGTVVLRMLAASLFILALKALKKNSFKPEAFG